MASIITAGFEPIITEPGKPAPQRTLPPPGRQMKASKGDRERVSKEIGMTWVDEPDILRQQAFE